MGRPKKEITDEVVKIKKPRKMKKEEIKEETKHISDYRQENIRKSYGARKRLLLKRYGGV